MRLEKACVARSPRSHVHATEGNAVLDGETSGERAVNVGERVNVAVNVVNVGEKQRSHEKVRPGQQNSPVVNIGERGERLKQPFLNADAGVDDELAF